MFVRDRGDGRRGSTRKTSPPDGKRAVTHVKVLETFGGFALVECRLETGRTHQVRIHLGEAGAPLCGETVYDRPVNGKPVPDGSGATAADAARGAARLRAPRHRRGGDLGGAARRRTSRRLLSAAAGAIGPTLRPTSDSVGS